MKHCAFIVLNIWLFCMPKSASAQSTGDLCTNPYTVSLQDPLVASCDYVEISGLDFTNFNDNVFSPSPSCNFGTDNNDIWVKLTVPSNADGFKITMDSSVITSVDNDYENFKVAVYSGNSCGSLTYKTCKSSSRARVYNNYFDGFNPGDNLYVRIYTDNSPSGTWDKPFFARFTSISTTNSNDACSNASVLVPGNYCNHLATDKGENDNKAPDKLTSTTAVCAPGSAEFGSFDNNQWYYFEVTTATPQPVQITISNVNCSAGDKILQAAIWKANSLTCSTWGNGYDLNNPSTASEGDLLACAVGTGTVTISENLPVGKYWYTIDGSAGSFCEYSITTAPLIPVPIRLINFYSKQSNTGDQLYWSCMAVTTPSFFIIEKSYDGIFFMEENTINVKENKMGLSHFNYSTENSTPVYYRLVVVESGQQPYYSDIIFSGNTLSEGNNFSIIYSEINDLTIFYKGKDKINVEIQLTDINGRVVFYIEKHSLITGKNSISLYNKKLSTGIYFLKILSKEQLYNFKVLIE